MARVRIRDAIVTLLHCKEHSCKNCLEKTENVFENTKQILKHATHKRIMQTRYDKIDVFYIFKIYTHILHYLRV